MPKPSAAIVNATDLLHEAPWYRQFWPWFLLVLPAVAVIACIVSLNIALRHGDSPVRDSYRKDGFAISRAAQLDRVAAARQLQADITIENSHLTIVLSGNISPRPAALTLQFIHPFAGARDFTQTLRHADGDRYDTQLPHGIDGRWTIELGEPGSTQWRLRGAIDLNAGAVHRFRLQP